VVPRLGYLVDSLQLYSALREIRPDVIYQRVACGYTGIAAGYARQHGARLIWHVSSDTDVNPERLRGGSNPIRRYLEKRSIEYGIRHANHLIAQTEAQARALERNYGRIADAVIHNFHPDPREKIDKTGPLSVVWVANLKPLKQPEVFVRLAEQMRDLAGVRFTMVGTSPSYPADWSAALLAKIRATPNLDYLGDKTQREVNELLARAHLFVNTSLHEGFPNTFIQAWMREVPVVSLNIDPDGVLGREAVGICAQSEARLAQAVRRLLTVPGERAEYGVRARRYAMLRHSMRNVEWLAQLIDSADVSSRPVSLDFARKEHG
jgi:glycosyltransferase involved in cell wall biosynthesis